MKQTKNAPNIFSLTLIPLQIVLYFDCEKIAAHVQLPPSQSNLFFLSFFAQLLRIMRDFFHIHFAHLCCDHEYLTLFGYPTEEKKKIVNGYFVHLLFVANGCSEV